MGSVLNVGAVRAALARQLRSRLGASVNVYDHPVTGPSLPCIQVRAGDPYVNYFVTMGDVGMADVRFVLDLQVAKATGESGAVLVDQLLSMGSTGSVPDAVFTDRTLGGVVEDCVVLVAGEPALLDAGNGTPVWQVDLPVQIIVKKEQA